MAVFDVSFVLSCVLYPLYLMCQPFDTGMYQNTAKAVQVFSIIAAYGPFGCFVLNVYVFPHCRGNISFTYICNRDIEGFLGNSAETFVFLAASELNFWNFFFVVSLTDLFSMCLTWVSISSFTFLDSVSSVITMLLFFGQLLQKSLLIENFPPCFGT